MKTQTSKSKFYKLPVAWLIQTQFSKIATFKKIRTKFQQMNTRMKNQEKKIREIPGIPKIIETFFFEEMQQKPT